MVAHRLLCSSGLEWCGASPEAFMQARLQDKSFCQINVQTGASSTKLLQKCPQRLKLPTYIYACRQEAFSHWKRKPLWTLGTKGGTINHFNFKLANSKSPATSTACFTHWEDWERGFHMTDEPRVQLYCAVKRMLCSQRNSWETDLAWDSLLSEQDSWANAPLLSLYFNHQGVEHALIPWACSPNAMSVWTQSLKSFAFYGLFISSLERSMARFGIAVDAERNFSLPPSSHFFS